MGLLVQALLLLPITHTISFTATTQLQSQHRHDRFCSSRRGSVLHSHSGGRRPADPSVVTPGTNSPPSSWPSVLLLTFPAIDGSPTNPDPQLLADLLMELGALSTSITNNNNNYIGAGPAQAPPALTCDTVAVGLNTWYNCTVTAQFPLLDDDDEKEQQDQQEQRILESISTAFDLTELPSYTIDIIDDDEESLSSIDWMQRVQNDWPPLVLLNNTLVIRCPWHTDADVWKETNHYLTEKLLPPSITLQGGTGFGTGEHPTTRLCLEFIHQQLVGTTDAPTGTTTNNKSIRLLDYGCGSGILGLVACRLSQNVTAVGIDIDPDAVDSANTNAIVNALPLQSFLPPDTTILDENNNSICSLLPPTLQGPVFDICVANILAEPLIELVPTLSSMMKPGGTIGMSGILADQSKTVMDAFSRHATFDHLRVEAVKGEWVLITGQKRK